MADLISIASMTAFKDGLSSPFLFILWAVVKVISVLVLGMVVFYFGVLAFVGIYTWATVGMRRPVVFLSKYAENVFYMHRAIAIGMWEIMRFVFDIVIGGIQAIGEIIPG